MTKNNFENFALFSEGVRDCAVQCFKFPIYGKRQNLRIRITRRSKEEAIWGRKFPIRHEDNDDI